MLKPISLTLAVLFSASSAASSIDVHGEIRIHGKTVIDAEGSLVTLDQPLVVNHSDLRCRGVIVTREMQRDYGVFTVVEDCTNPDISLIQNRTVYNDGRVVENTYRTTVIDDERTFSETFRSDSDGVEGSYSRQVEWVRYSEPHSQLVQGVESTYHRVAIASDKQCSGYYQDRGYCDESTESFVNPNASILTLLSEDTRVYEVGGQHIEGCYQVREASRGLVYSGSDWTYYSTMCPRIGVLADNNRSVDEIVSIEFVEDLDDHQPGTLSDADMIELGEVPAPEHYPWIR
ncbi:hypothetical protein [Ferrimonas marina]|uniref:OstA-like protein n=1 Tax=Ferrimonas marina TaxID=299255 RepID=A0A1M5U2M5_9GAMM|nr:hypothetical protein [Ferrimonas marina]SHH57110.1 hypothetical protein SAMN02745129_2376 [Ferrimonas marina]